jgi:adenylate cyclase
MLDVFSDPRLQPARLASGLVLFAFAFAHFANHAVGLIGIDAMNWVQDLRLTITQSTAGRIVLPLAAATHILLGLGKLAARRTLRLPRWEWLQIVSGVLVPALLIPHVIAITYFANKADYFYSYTSVAYLMWPTQALWQSGLLLVVWLHGCIGITYWLRPKPWFGAVRSWLFGSAIAVPVLALTGFLAAARETNVLFADPAARAAAASSLNWPSPAVVAAMADVRSLTWFAYAALLTLVMALFAARQIAVRAAPAVRVAYAGDRTVKAAIGTSLLDISRMHAIPHTSVCGGRARCSTCRVRIDRGGDDLPAPEAIERATLRRIMAPPNVRLACQLRPTADLGVTRLVTPSATATGRVLMTDASAAGDAAGVEKQVAILFLDVRGFTRLAQNRLPFDVVFLLNQFFATVGDAIRAQNGWIDKYMGDGLMAVFGREQGVASGCRQALAAASAIDHALDDLNRRLATELPEGIRVGMGVHAGPVVIGEIGAPGSAALTVIGRTVNEASRLEALTKDFKCQLIVSRVAAEKAGLALDGFARETVAVRGADSRLDIVLITAARDLPDGSTAAVTAGREPTRA